MGAAPAEPAAPIPLFDGVCNLCTGAAKAALFLVSEDSSFMAGAEIIVDGGLSQF